jgi:glutamate synthase (NADPH/NADH) large chain
VLSAQEQKARVDEAIWHSAGSGPNCDEFILRELLEKHFRFTGSFRSKEILQDWERMRTRFVKVFPNEYRRALKQMADAQRAAGAEKLAA